MDVLLQEVQQVDQRLPPLGGGDVEGGVLQVQDGGTEKDGVGQQFVTGLRKNLQPGGAVFHKNHLD